MSDSNFDLIIIGAGPGGYVARSGRAARAEDRLRREPGDAGGTCLNVVHPVQGLLHASELFEEAAHGTWPNGGSRPRGSSSTSTSCMRAGARRSRAYGGIEFLFKKNKVPG